MKQNVLMSLLAGCCMTACAESSPPLAEIKKAVTEGRAVLVDVREQNEWDAGHLKAARLLPLSRLQADAKAAAGLPKDKVIYIHCRSGRRAVTAAEILKKQGFNACPLPQQFSDLSRENL
jgi:rhodanese-related sulfurtransferase